MLESAEVQFPQIRQGTIQKSYVEAEYAERDFFLTFTTGRRDVTQKSL